MNQTVGLVQFWSVVVAVLIGIQVSALLGGRVMHGIAVTTAIVAVTMIVLLFKGVRPAYA